MMVFVYFFLQILLLFCNEKKHQNLIAKTQEGIKFVFSRLFSLYLSTPFTERNNNNTNSRKLHDNSFSLHYCGQNTPKIYGFFYSFSLQSFIFGWMALYFCIFSIHLG